MISIYLDPNLGRSQNTLPARLADNNSISQNYGKKYVLSRVYHER